MREKRCWQDQVRNIRKQRWGRATSTSPTQRHSEQASLNLVSKPPPLGQPGAHSRSACHRLSSFNWYDSRYLSSPAVLSCQLDLRRLSQLCGIPIAGMIASRTYNCQAAEADLPGLGSHPLKPLECLGARVGERSVCDNQEPWVGLNNLLKNSLRRGFSYQGTALKPALSESKGAEAF